MNQLESDLDGIGQVYTNSATNITVPAGTDTLVLSNPTVPFGTYIAFGTVLLTTQQPTGGAMFALRASKGGNYNLEVPTISFLGNATISGVAVFSEANDSARLWYYSTGSVTINSITIRLIRIK